MAKQLKAYIPQSIMARVNAHKPDPTEQYYIPTDKDRALAKRLGGLGLPMAQIAACMNDGEGVSLAQLKHHLGREITAGKAEANAVVAKAVYEKAMSGDTQVLLWWTKSQMAWTETTKHQVVQEVDGEQEVKAIRRTIIDIKND